MHASVIAGQIESCQLVMEMVSDIEFLKRMYGTQQRAEENSKRLVDLYLNTPDKSVSIWFVFLAFITTFVNSNYVYCELL